MRPQGLGSVAGTLRNADGEPLAGVHLGIDDVSVRWVAFPDFKGCSTVAASTDGDGRFRIDNIPAGSFDLRGDARGSFTENLAEVEVRAGRTTRVDLVW